MKTIQAVKVKPRTIIEGVKTKTLRVIPDERGRLMEVLRSDDTIFEKFGQIYVTTAYPGVVNEFFMGDHHQILLKVPAGIVHGFKCISDRESIVINIPTEVYHYDKPDEYRLDAHSTEVPYDWSRKDG